MLNRQKIVLLMLRKAGGQTSRLQLMKWLFLLAQEAPTHGGKSFYQFLPYRFGPYSFSLHQEVNALIHDGLVEQPDARTWKLTSVALQTGWSLPLPIQQDVSAIMNRYGHMAVGSLTASVYKRYPWFTVNSQKLKRCPSARPVAELAVYTMGYEGLMVDGFLNSLMRVGIQRLIDVRSNPVSRRYGYHKSTLSRLCSYLQIEYCHMPELGVASKERQNLKSPADYEALFDYYREESLSRQTDAMQKLAQLLREKASVLVCMEADPEFCHRSQLAEAVAPIVGLPVIHLGWPR